MTGTTSSGGTYDHNKEVSAGQGEGYSKAFNTTGTTASGKNYSRSRGRGRGYRPPEEVSESENSDKASAGASK